jgi:hypothetical protein
MPLPLALSGGASIAGTGLGLINGQRTARRQDRATRDNIYEQQGIQRNIDRAIQGNVGELANSNPAQDRARLMSQFVAAIKGNQGQLATNLPQGVGSSRFSADTNAAKGRSIGGANRLATIMSVLDGAMSQRRREGLSRNNLGLDIDALARRSSGAASLGNMRVNSIQRNPWMDAGASFLSGLGKGG